MEPERRHFEGAVAFGLATRTSNADEMDPDRARIGGLWRRFAGERVAERVAGTGAPPACVGVYFDYASDHTGPYSVLAGVLADADAPVPSGLTRVALPAGDYLVFRGEGEIPEVVVDTWGAVWEHCGRAAGPRRRYTTDFELYGAGGGVEIFVATA